MPYLYLLLGIAASLGLSLLLKMYEHAGRERLVVIAANYIAATSSAFLLAGNLHFTFSVILYGAGLGFFFFFSFVMMGYSLKTEGISSTVTMSRLSLGIPVALSVLFWGERPELNSVVGLCLIVFIIIFWQGKWKKFSPVLLAMFFLMGLIDSGMKFFKMVFQATENSAFLGIVFGSALIWSWAYLLIRKIPVKKSDLLAGFLLGVPNYFASFFVLQALSAIPAFIVFPVFNTGLICGSAVVGAWLFSEKLTPRRLVMLGLAVIAVLLLTI